MTVEWLIVAFLLGLLISQKGGDAKQIAQALTKALSKRQSQPQALPKRERRHPRLTRRAKLTKRK